MPFIETKQRPKMDELIEHLVSQPLMESYGISVGEWCYYYYKPMVDAWRKEPRWTTAHNIYRDQVVTRRKMPNLPLNKLPLNKLVALELAWQVFFNLYVMPYELKKRKENGDI